MYSKLVCMAIAPENCVGAAWVTPFAFISERRIRSGCGSSVDHDSSSSPGRWPLPRPGSIVAPVGNIR